MCNQYDSVTLSDLDTDDSNQNHSETGSIFVSNQVNFSNVLTFYCTFPFRNSAI